MAGSDPGPDISDLFCHYNALYFHDSLGACAVSCNINGQTEKIMQMRQMPNTIY